MTTPTKTLALAPSGFYHISFETWGTGFEARPLVFCVHALTRRGSDFAPLAQVLDRRGYRICAPDLPGRGNSDWLPSADDYAFENYIAASSTLLSRFGPGPVHWVGTSLGGIIGMLLASMPNSPIASLVLNDIGAFIPKSSLDRICSYLGADPYFNSEQEAENYLREVHAGFGPLSDDEWADLMGRSLRPDGAGFRLHYDPAIKKVFQANAATDIDLWPVWEAITCPVLIIRGEQSDLLTEPTVKAMSEGKPGVTAKTIAKTGHAPTLVADDQTALIADWLDHQNGIGGGG